MAVSEVAWRALGGVICPGGTDARVQRNWDGAICVSDGIELDARIG